MSGKPPKLPAIQFYTGDWMKDPAVRSVSYAAKGLWIDMLCLMSESDPRGFLKMNGQPPSASQLARMTGGEPGEVSTLLTELEQAGVFSTDRGVIFCRRMVADERKRMLCREAGAKGGNPTLKGIQHHTVKGKADTDNGEDNTLNRVPKGSAKGAPKGQPTPSSSALSSASSSTSPFGEEEKKDAAAPPGSAGRKPTAQQELAEYFALRWSDRYHRKYPPHKLTFVKAAELLTAVGGSMGDAKLVIDRYLADAGVFYNGHPIGLLTSATQLPRFIAQISQKGSNHGPRKPSPADRGEFPEFDSDLPDYAADEPARAG